MLNGIDHIVIVVPDLERAVRSYAALGFTVVLGGKHPIGTENALIGFSDGAYLELLAFLVPDSPHPWFAALASGGGLVDFCMQIDDLRSEMALFARAGVELAEPMRLTRERPDGYRLSWVLSFPPVDRSGALPFLISDETPREERVPREVAHPNGVTGIEALTVAVRDASELRKIYTRVCGNVARDLRRDDLAGAGFAVRFGPHGVELLSPASSTGPLADRLRARGPGPYAVRLRTRGGTPGPLDQARTLGVPLTLV